MLSRPWTQLYLWVPSLPLYLSKESGTLWGRGVFPWVSEPWENYEENQRPGSPPGHRELTTLLPESWIQFPQTTLGHSYHPWECLQSPSPGLDSSQGPVPGQHRPEGECETVQGLAWISNSFHTSSFSLNGLSSNSPEFLRAPQPGRPQSSSLISSKDGKRSLKPFLLLLCPVIIFLQSTLGDWRICIMILNHI